MPKLLSDDELMGAAPTAGAAPQLLSDDDLVPETPVAASTPRAETDRSMWETADDTLSATLQGGANLAGGLLEVSRYTPHMRALEYFLDDDTPMPQDYLQENFTTPATQYWQEDISPGLEAQRRVLTDAQGLGGTWDALVENPGLVGDVAAQQILPLLAQVGLVGKMAPAAQGAGGVFSEALQGGGETGLQVRQQVDAIPEKVLLEDPDFAARVSEVGLPAARAELADNLAQQGTGAGAVVTGLLGRLMGDQSRIAGALAGDAVGGLSGVARRTGVEGLSEGLQEPAQGAVGDALVSQADSRVAAWDTDARLKEALLGTIMGVAQNTGLEGVRALRGGLRGQLEEQGVDTSQLADREIQDLVRRVELISEEQQLTPELLEEVLAGTTGTDRPAPTGSGLPPEQAAQARSQVESELGALFQGTDVNRRADLQVDPEAREATPREGAQPMRDATGRQASPETYGSVQAAANLAEEMGLTLRPEDLDRAAAEIQANPDVDPRDVVRSYDQAGVAAAFDQADLQRRRGEEYQEQRAATVQEFESLPEQEQARIRKEYADQGIDPDQVENTFNRAARSEDMRDVGDMRADQGRERTQQAAQPAFDIAEARRARREQALDEGYLGRDFRAGANRPEMQEGVAPEDPQNPWVPDHQGLQGAVDEGRITINEAERLMDLRLYIDQGIMSEAEGTARARQILFPNEAPTMRQRQELNESSREVPQGVNEGQPGQPRNSVDRISSTSIGGRQGDFIPGNRPQQGPTEPGPAPERDVTPMGTGIEDQGAAPADFQQPAPQRDPQLPSPEGQAPDTDTIAERERAAQKERDAFVESVGPIEPGTYRDVDTGTEFEVLPTGMVMTKRRSGDAPYGTIAGGQADQNGVAFASYIRDGLVERTGATPEQTTDRREEGTEGRRQDEDRPAGGESRAPERKPAQPVEFHKAITEAQRATPNGASVHVYPVSEYEGMQLFLYDDGRAGFAITPSGGLVSVFKHPDSTMSGALDTMVPEAISQGATTLDAFEGFLTESYAKHGFKEVDRLPWDPQYAPDGWDTQTMGEPDVVIMEVANESVQPQRPADSQPVQQPEGVRSGAQEVQGATEQRGGDRGGREAGGSEAPLPGAPTVEGASGPDPKLNSVAQDYARQAGIDLTRQEQYVEVDVDRAERIAQAYADMEHNPSDPAVQAAYQDLIEQTTAQYQALVDAGYEFYFFDETNDPYDGNPWNAMRELRGDQRMGVFATESGFGSGDTDLDVADNPLLQDTGLEWPYGGPDGPMKRVTANDLFRAVHDAFGHGLEGAGFRARGEENAWQAHARLFTGPALGALTSETRGQNSWLNYGPHGDTNRTAGVEDTIFADQKTGLMPEWTWTEGLDAGDTATRQQLDNANPNPDGEPEADASADTKPKKKKPKLYTQAYGGIPLDALVDAIKRVIGSEARAYRYTAEQIGELVGHMKEAVGGVTGSNRGTQRSLLADLWRVTFATMDGDLRMLAGKFKSPTLAGLADKFHALAGSDAGVGQSFDEAVQARNKRLQEVDQIVSIMRDAGLNKPESRKQIIRLLENPSTPRRGVMGEVANRIEKYLKDELKYLRDAGVELGEVRGGYFPREMDLGKVATKPDVFRAQATKAYQEMGMPLEQAKEAARAYYESTVYGASGKPGDTRPSSQTPKFTQSRTFSKKAAEHLRQFMLDDIDAVLGQYTMRATKRAEIARRFGDNWSEWEGIEKQMIEEDSKVQEILPAVRDRVALSAGVRLDNSPQLARASMSLLRTFTTLATLPKSAFASLGELVVAPIRGTTGQIPGDVGVTLANILSHGINFARMTTGMGRSEAMLESFEMAEDIGIIAGTGHNSLMAARFAGGDPVGKAQSTVLSEFFKRNMLEHLTNYTRVTSMRNGQVFLRRLARQMERNPKKTGVFLRELGVPRGKEEAFAQWVRDLGDDLPGVAEARGPYGGIYRNALQRFTDQTVMRPSASTRPKWASHPLGALLFQLQAFGYAFQKNVINRSFRVAANKELDAMDRMAFSLSILSGFALLTVAQGIVRWARDEIYNPEVNDRKTDWAFVEGALSQAGLFGVADPYMQALSGVRYQKNPAQIFLGPALGGLTDASGDFLAASLANSPNTNTAERNAWKAGYDWMLEPLMQTALTAVPGGAVTGPLRSAATVYGVPAGRDPFADVMAGPAKAGRKTPPIQGALEFLFNGAKQSGGERDSGRGSGRDSGRGSGRDGSR